MAFIISNTVAYYSSSRKLRDEAIRDLFTALLSHIDASEYSYSTTRGWQIPYLVRNLTVGNDGVRLGIHYFKYRSLLFVISEAEGRSYPRSI
ncbi:hypothetical protein, partial [Photobacterium iliopiscarium]|uniref:hypothetical protein n=1 Tax=Photobacterium iliopiscarium TaxID=56192 RepID=UPI001C6348CF